MISIQYKRIPGSKRGLVSSNSLWLGKDHLLSVKSTWFSEDYKRFYYSDIQSMVVIQTEQYRCELMVIMCLGILAIILNMLWNWYQFFIIAGSFIISWLIIVLYKGPTCVCYIQTPIQQEKLLSLHRLKTVRKAFNLLIPLIHTAQGVIDREEFIKQFEKIDDSISNPYQIKFIDFTWHITLFIINGIIGIILTIDLYFRYVSEIYFLTITSLIVFCGLSAVAYPSIRSNMYSHKNIQIFTWMAFGSIIADMVLVGLGSIIGILTNKNKLQILDAITSMVPIDDSVWKWGYVVCIFLSIGIGFLGILVVKMQSSK